MRTTKLLKGVVVSLIALLSFASCQPSNETSAELLLVRNSGSKVATSPGKVTVFLKAGHVNNGVYLDGSSLPQSTSAEALADTGVYAIVDNFNPSSTLEVRTIDTSYVTHTELYFGIQSDLAVVPVISSDSILQEAEVLSRNTSNPQWLEDELRKLLSGDINLSVAEAAISTESSAYAEGASSLTFYSNGDISNRLELRSVLIHELVHTSKASGNLSTYFDVASLEEEAHQYAKASGDRLGSMDAEESLADLLVSHANELTGFWSDYAQGKLYLPYGFHNPHSVSIVASHPAV